MKKITTLLLSMACMALAANAGVTVHVKTLDGSTPYLYAWDGGGNTLNGDWPGTIMDATNTSTTPDGKVWITQAFDVDAANVIFNDGGDPAIQTADIRGATGDVYYIVDLEEGEYQDVTSTYVQQEEFDKTLLPEGVTFKEGKLFAYFRTKWANVNCWCWNDSENFTGGSWPGQACTKVGTDRDGYSYFLWEGPALPEVLPTGIIFNNGSSQTNDLTFVNGGLYELGTSVDPLIVIEGGEDPGIKGDVNGDGEVTVGDVSAIYDIMLGLSENNKDKADVNGDGEITVGDVSAVYDIMLGL